MNLSKPFRILMILDQPFPQDTRVENEATALVNAGFDVLLLVLAPDTRSREEKYQGFTIIRRNVPAKYRNWMRGLAGTVPILSWFIARQVRLLYQEYSIDAIHAHDLYMCGGALRAGKRLGIPVIADLHESWVAALKTYAWSTRFPGRLFINYKKWKSLEREWTHKAINVIVTTEEMQSHYVKLGVSENNTTVLPNTINIKAFDNYPLNENIIHRHQSEFTLVYTGGINLHRGLGFLLQTIPLVLPHCHTRLVIVGEGQIRSELEDQSKILGLNDHVIFEGWRPQEEIKSYILASDACLIPQINCEHTSSTVPHKLFHYMYLGRPVIATNCTYIQHIVETTDCGVVVPYGDQEALASSIIELYNDPDRRKQMGMNGRMAVRECYNWENSARSLVNMYSRISKVTGTSAE